MGLVKLILIMEGLEENSDRENKSSPSYLS